LNQNIRTDKLKIEGMSCTNCESKIENTLLKTNGIKEANVSYANGIAKVTYDADSISLEKIIDIIEKLGYRMINDYNNKKGNSENTNMIGTVIIIFALYIITKHFGLLNLFNIFPEAEAGMGYGMLFLIGLLTSVHCIAMCGGINLSQCIPQNTKKSDSNELTTLKPCALYNLGRVISYTVVGALVGALGSVISFSGNAKGLVQIVASLFMIIMGLNMLNVAPWLRKLNPRMPKIFSKKINNGKSSNVPLYVGLLNGLMPCGPLQAMQLYALSTGDPIKGALSMFVFSIGTVPLMFGLGALSTILSQKFTKKAMSVGAVLVIILGFSMFNSGLSLSGFASTISPSDSNVNRAIIEDGIQVINTTLSSGRYEAISVKAGIPVKWTITAEKGTINGCNNRIFIPEYGIEKKFQLGDNVIEFTPTETGTFTYSCWMGMIRSTITVED